MVRVIRNATGAPVPAWTGRQKLLGRLVAPHPFGFTPAQTGTDTPAAAIIQIQQIGQMQNFGNLYLNRYANEAAYREDTRRRSNGDIFQDIMTRCAQSPVSRHFCGYWQGNKKPMETLI